MSFRNCPTREQLSDFSIGVLPPDVAETVAAHVDTCVDCERALAGLGRQQDSLMRQLRNPAPGLAELDSPEYQRAMEAAKAVGQSGVATFAAPVAEPSLSDLGHLGRYELLSKLGAGGMGTVYKARQVVLNKIVALKVLPKDRTSDARAVARFDREMKAIGQLSHPSIVQAHDAGDIDGTTVLVMEYVDGLDLAKVTKAVTPLGIADACELVRQTAVGLQYIHENGLVHRDIKPSNLMLTRQGQVKILDLGLALLGPHQATDNELTSNGLAMGTPDYIAPEQAGDSHRVDIRADIYSLGCTLYHLLTGRAPFSGPSYKTPFEKVIAHARDTAPAVRASRPEVSSQLSAVVERMMAKDPAARFSTPAEVAAALAPFAVRCDLGRLLATATATNPVPAESEQSAMGTSPHVSSAFTGTDPNRPSPQASLPPWWRRRRNWMVAAAALPLLLIFGIVMYIVMNGYGTVKIDISDPSANVSVKVDGETIEITGLEKPLKLKAGPHGLLITSSDYETVTNSFTVRRGENAVLKITLIPINALVKLELIPASAHVTVEVDGKAIDPGALREPLKLMPGQHELVVTSNEYERVKQPFAVHRGENPVLPVRLTPIGPQEAGWNYSRCDREGSGFYPHPSKIRSKDAFIPLWSADVRGLRSVATGDVTGDGTLKVVTANEREVCIFDASGQLANRFSPPARTGHLYGLLLADFSGRGAKDILVGTESTPDLHGWAYTGSGTMLKQFQFRGNIRGDCGIAPVAVNADRVLVSLGAGYGLYPRGWAAFDKATGKLLWQYKIGPAPNPASVGTFSGRLRMTTDCYTVNNGASGDGWNHNGTPTTDHSICTICVNDDGAEVFTHDYHSSGGIRNYFVDLDGNGRQKMLAFEFHDATYYHGINKIHLLDADTGAVLKTFNGLRDVEWSGCVWGDLAGQRQGRVAASNARGAYLFDANLALIASSDSNTMV